MELTKEVIEDKIDRLLAGGELIYWDNTYCEMYTLGKICASNLGEQGLRISILDFDPNLSTTDMNFIFNKLRNAEAEQRVRLSTERNEARRNAAEEYLFR